MGFFGKLVSATVKTALTPLTVVSDTINVITGQEPTDTISLLGSALEDAVESLEDLADGDMI